MAASAGTVVLNLDANAVKMIRELQKAQRQTQRTATTMKRKMGRAMKNIAQSAKAMGVAIAVALGARMLRDVVNAGLAMDRFSRTFKVATGSIEAARSEMEFISELTNRLGVDLLTAAGAYAKLTAAAKGTSLAGAGTRKIFTSLAEATMVLGLSAADATQILTAVEQMISKGKVSAEELRRQMQKLPGAFQMAARAVGVTTQELDKMLKDGKLLAEDLLPNLAIEMHKTFGPGVEEASNSTQAALARFTNAIFQLKAGIAESGVMDALAAFAQGIANVINPSLHLDIEKTQARLKKLNERVAELRAVDPSSRGAERAGTELFGLLPQIEEAEIRLDGLFMQIGRLHLGNFTGGETGAEKRPAGLDAFLLQYESVEDKISRLRNELEEMRPFIEETWPGMYERALADINSIWGDGIEEFNVQSIRMKKKYFETTDEMTEFAKQAARNMQDAFADFLFDPFAEGLKGMLKGFLDIIRRMIAEQAAANIFGKDGGKLTGFFASIFGGARALGGPVSAGTPYLVGERGPELMVPGSSGTIIPNNKMGGVSVVNHYSISAGADWETLQKVLPPLFEQNRRETIGQLTQMKAEGAV